MHLVKYSGPMLGVHALHAVREINLHIHLTISPPLSGHTQERIDLPDAGAIRTDVSDAESGSRI